MKWINIIVNAVLSLLTVNAVAGDSSTMEHLTQDQAEITSIVESVGVMADRGEFDALARLYADEFILDYSSLNGQAAAIKTSSQLMAEWSSVLPGFDLTQHDVSNVRVTVIGDEATATADVVASHWINDLFWQVTGTYDYKLARTQDWQITAMTFHLDQEQGTRDVFAPAIANANNQPQPGNKQIVAERNKQSVRSFFKHLEDESVIAMIDLFAVDGVQINPYHNDLFPAGAAGREALLAYWKPVPGNFDGMQFPILELLATENPSVVFVRYRGQINLKDNAGVYENDYFSIFRFNPDGEITEYVEVFDPVVAARGFGMLDQLK